MFLQHIDDGGVRLVTSASDLTAASSCEFAFLRRVDAKLGREVHVPADDDAMLARAATLGDDHEERVLQAYRDELGTGVVEIARPAGMSVDALEDVAAQTEAALRGPASLVFQATFFDPAQRSSDSATGDPEIGFIGFADFLARREDGAWQVQDSKLARRAKVTALMQLAAYAEQLERIGVRVAEDAVLILGDGARSTHRVADIAPTFRARRARLHELILARYRTVGADGSRQTAEPIAWGDQEVFACGRCEVCTPEVQRTRDSLLIAGLQRGHRNALAAAGFTTIDDVAAMGEGTEVSGVSARTLERIVAQARVQTEAREGEKPPVRVIDAGALGRIPQQSPGDLFFDFEGDPLYLAPSPDGAPPQWGLDYLFGMVDVDAKFTPLWAHTLDEERQALLDFLELVRERRRVYPDMHIYHYAAYERTHLSSIAARHGVGEQEVDQLLREHVLVDLYPIVRRALRVGSRSYSIKKLEPLYMGEKLRNQDGVTNGGESVTEYAEASEQLRSTDAAIRAEGQRRLDDIGEYNEYDCLSTLRLRDWLLGIAEEHGVTPFLEIEDDQPDKPFELSPVAEALQRHAEELPDPRDRRTAALAASAIDYHQREQKSFWQAHFARLTDPIEDWADTRDVVVVDPLLSRVEEDWHVPDTPRARAFRRHLKLRGEVAPGSSLKSGDVHLVYEYPAPFVQARSAPGARGVRRAKIIERLGDGVLVEEMLGKDEEYRALPVAVTPGPPPHAGAQKTAIEEWGVQLAADFDAGRRPADPVFDLLRRDTPRLTGGGALVDPASAEALAAVEGDDSAALNGAVIASLRRLDRSALAVQGPPGTGKTYLASRVIRRLVEEDGWRIGVVAQSHRVVENVLAGVASAGLAPEQIGKVPQTGADPADLAEAPYTVLPKDGQASFLAGHQEAGRGCVVGGTAWDFSKETRVERRSLDLLVVDEAGQFSLAPTIASSVAAERLLLLGDPQQLPQVSQGTHPEPVDTSALEWLLGGHGTIPADLGYFLAETRRMRPELATVVSDLSYEGRLHAHPSASDRSVEGVGPAGLVWHPVSHRGNTTLSPEEAAAVVAIARDALGATLREASCDPRPVTENDLIVVVPYNAQVECVTDALEEAGLASVRVGTVDKFQGQEAAIAIVSLAASSAEDAARGLDFLLMRNRLNVAISRAQWAAHLVSSDRLGDGLPHTVEGLAALSGYLGLVESATRASAPDER